MAIQIEWTEDDIDISVEYDAEDVITKVFITAPVDIRVTAFDALGVEKFSAVVTAGSHEYSIPPGQLKRNQDVVSIAVGLP